MRDDVYVERARPGHPRGLTCHASRACGHSRVSEECTELPRTSAWRGDRAAGLRRHLPGFFMSGVDNLLGLNGFQKAWGGHENTYRFGAHLSKQQKSMLKPRRARRTLPSRERGVGCRARLMCAFGVRACVHAWVYRRERCHAASRRACRPPPRLVWLACLTSDASGCVCLCVSACVSCSRWVGVSCSLV